MEDIKAYIESGILELYVLGDLSPNEKLQVEEMAKMHPEISAELNDIQTALEAYAAENAIEPPAQLRDRVLNSLLTNFADDRNFNTKPFVERDEIEEDYAETEDNIRALPTARPNSFYKYAFAASLAALIISLIALYNTSNRLSQSEGQIALLQSRNQSFANRVNYLDNEIDVFRDSSVKIIRLQGTPKAPASKLTLAWNPKKKQVMIDMKDMELAQNDKDHQYQLWAIVNNKPVDLGVFDAKPDTVTKYMLQMKPVANATVFAVTLEKRGGVPSPTMDQMVLAAKI
ncbi:anti-sigma-K factor rskA [Mucilaginibacter gracilis]|uniref:Regulator of SigK n=1 Tax=Mucilaginibacter gracilis TaxID=423350 RepID=A0A495J9Z5_9SPHI|nr:anti-sigma factor [Mucilaginibacter gracilis]RKR85521.1 anti-sigma-K factor rskA [Mucilaginibacter gracilis]